MKKYYILLFAFIFYINTYAQEAAIINNSSSGSIGGVSFTISGIVGPSVLSLDYSSGFYSAAPLSDNQRSIFYNNTSEWSISFESNVENFKLYCADWKSTELTFSQPFSVLSEGVNLQKSNNNTLVVNNNSGNGIIEFSGSINSLAITSISGANGSIQAMTFGKTDSPLSTINSPKQKYNTKIFPNPSSKTIKISNIKEKSSYTIYNVIGSEVAKGFVSKNEVIDISNYNNGLYFIKLDDGNMLKFVKQ